MLAASFSAKVYSFFHTVLWIACLNLLWVGFTAVGLGVLGVGPATAAAHILVRRRIRRDAASLPWTFVKEYRRNFAKANTLALPVLLAGAALWLNWKYFSAGSDLPSQLMAASTFAAAIFLAGTGCHLFPMFARYELPLAQYLPMASRFALRNLAGTAILLFVTACVVFASQSVPGLIPFFSIGAWLYLTGWLCDRFFTANDESLTAGSIAVPAAVPSAEGTAGALGTTSIAVQAGVRLG